jgi:hypothetical protein
LENLQRYNEAIDVYLSIPDGRNEYYGWRATERLRALSTNEKAKQFGDNKLVQLLQQGGTLSPDEQRKNFQSAYRLTGKHKLSGKHKKSYVSLPDYQKIPSGNLLDFGRKEVLKQESKTSSDNHHKNLADELLF